MKKKLGLVGVLVGLLVILTAYSGSVNSGEPQIQVPIDLEIVKNNQKQVDQGHSPWQLDPLQVAMTFVGLQIYPEGITGDFPVENDALEIVQEGPQTIVKVSSEKTDITKIYLKQLVKQGKTGIWSVIGYDVDEKRNRA